MTWLCLALVLQTNSATGFTPFHATQDAILEGAWQSCPDSDGDYGERVFVIRMHNKTIGELHLGPREQFSVFAGEVPGERSHESAENLLRPAFHFDDVLTRVGGRNWAIGALNLHLNVVSVPTSNEECYGFLVLMRPLNPSRTLAAR
jgi:hypothetical protein